MTSVIRTYPVGSRLPDPARYVMLTYTTSDGYSAPFPWRFNKQTQAIDIEFVNGFNASTDPSSGARYVRGHSLHAAHNVLTLGPNFVRWMETYDNDNGIADVGSVVMTERPIILSTNAVAPNESPLNSVSDFSDTNPISFESSAGSFASSYLKTMIFLKPLVIRYKVNGVTQYRYFTSHFEGTP